MVTNTDQCFFFFFFFFYFQRNNLIPLCWSLVVVSLNTILLNVTNDLNLELVKEVIK